MIAIILALTSALAYGVSDFLSGNASRTVHYARVALITQVVMTGATWCAVGFFPGSLSPEAMLWGALAGTGSSFGTLLLYRGLGSGAMNVVAPLSAATAALVPVVVGLALGERPTWVVLTGIAVILPAIWLISSGAPQPRGATGFGAGTADGLLAGVAFAISFIALDRAPVGGGLWPAAYAQLSALVVVGIAATWVLRGEGRDRTGSLGAAAAAAACAGLLGAVAVASFLFATGRGLLVVVSVLTSLYPAVTVLLAMVVLKERSLPIQRLGLLLGALGVVLVALG